jgi:hypothetical protein
MPREEKYEHLPISQPVQGFLELVLKAQKKFQKVI